MKIHFLLILVFTFILPVTNLSGQFYNAGSDPSSIKWRQIKTGHFNLIYPSEIDSLAQKYANVLENVRSVSEWGLNSNPKNIKIVLHNQNVVSNGWVMWAPRRMEIITVPPQDNYPHNWLEQLGIHEYRHLVQVSKLNQGLTKFLTLLTGDFAMGAEVGYMPLWYIEGDAVLMETVMSSTGRGRDALFDQGLRAIELQNKKRYSYDQAYLGSYRSNIPNHYNYGYQMVTWATYKFGNTCWDKTYSNIAKKPFMLAPFYYGLKKKTGLSKTGLYHQAFDSIGAIWRKNMSGEEFTSADTIPVSYKSDYVSYRFPYQLPDKRIVALRSSVDDISRLVIIKNGKETNLYTVGNFYGSQIAFSPKYIAWEEIHNDIRWEQKSYSTIKILDIEKGKTTILKSGEKQFSPSISPSGKIIAINKVDLNGNSWLEVYDIDTKQLTHKCLHPEKQQITYSTWIDENKMALVCLGENGKSIYIYTVNSQSWNLLLGPTFNNISGLNFSNNKLFFTWQLEGKADIFSIDLYSREVSRITHMQIGSEFPSISESGNGLFFSEYTSNGYKLRYVKLNDQSFYPVISKKSNSYSLVDSISSIIHFNIQDSTFVQKKYESKHYSKLAHSVNVHTWIPFYFDYENMEVSEGLNGLANNLHPGFIVLSQNVLSNVTSVASYYYSDGYHYVKPSIYIRTIYPVISFSILAGGPSKKDTITAVPNRIYDKTDKGYLANMEISIPLCFSSSRITSYFTPKIDFKYQNRYIIDTVIYTSGNYDFYDKPYYFYQGNFSVDYNVYFYIANKMAYRNLIPRWSFSFYISSMQPYINKQYFTSGTLGYISFATPGFFRNHSVKVLAQIEDGYGLRLSLPRGYMKDDYKRIYYKKQISMNYSFPLLYPDLSFGPVIYLKRIHTNLFYDMADYRVNQNRVNHSGTLQSFGGEFAFEMHLLRFFMPITPVIQYSYLLTTQKNHWLFYISTNYSFSLGHM